MFDKYYLYAKLESKIGDPNLVLCPCQTQQKAGHDSREKEISRSNNEPDAAATMVAFLDGCLGFPLALRADLLAGGMGAIICGGGGRTCGTWWGIARSVTLPSLLVSPPVPGIIALLSPVCRFRLG